MSNLHQTLQAIFRKYDLNNERRRPRRDSYNFDGYEVKLIKRDLPPFRDVADVKRWLFEEPDGRRVRATHKDIGFDDLAAHLFHAATGTDPRNEKAGDEAWSLGATHSDEEELLDQEGSEPDEESEVEEQEGLAMQTKQYEAVRLLAKRASGMEAITASVMKSDTGLNLTRQQFDQIIADHAAAVGKKLETVLLDPPVARAYQHVARCNGFPL
jgi:hypothetical protein